MFCSAGQVRLKFAAVVAELILQRSLVTPTCSNRRHAKSTKLHVSTTNIAMESSGLKPHARRCHELPLKVVQGVPARTLRRMLS